jgi:hypothetical protein
LPFSVHRMQFIDQPAEMNQKTALTGGLLVRAAASVRY